MVEKKVHYLQKKYHCLWTLLRGEKPKWIFHNLSNPLRPLESVPASRERLVPTEWQVRTVLGVCIPRAEVIPAQAPQYPQRALLSDFLDLVQYEYKRRSSIGHELVQGPTRRVETTEPYVGYQDGPIYKQFTEKSDCRRPLRNSQMRVFGLRETIDPSRESIGNCKGFFPAYESLRRHFLQNVHFQCCVLLQGTLGGDFDIFAASSGESTAWVLLWKTRSA